MQKIYIDFDGTLFNTDELYRGFKCLCNSWGITDLDMKLAMNNTINKYGLYSLEKIIKLLKEKYNLDKKFDENFEKLFSDKYVYDDVVDSLEKLSKKYELILFTFGDEYQWHKIECSGLKNYFSDVIVSDKNKSQLNNVDYNNSIFIDNNVKTLIDLYNTKAKKVIRIRRRSDKYSKIETGIKDIVEYTDFLELVEKEFINEK